MHLLDIGFPGETLGVRAVVADVVLDGLGADAWHRFNSGSMEKQIAVCPLPGAGGDLFQLQAPVPLEDVADEPLRILILPRIPMARTPRQACYCQPREG